jgi:nucleotide-binding universal stress UspA family protein
MDENRVVPDDEHEAEVEAVSAETIVVGHDRSAGANAALRVALQLASDIGAPVAILRAWSLVTAPRPDNWTFGYAPSEDELEEAVRAELIANTTNEVARYPELEVTYRAYHAGPARSLIEASRDARMLVVGCRGMGGFQEMVMGSVSDQVVRHAHCPVLVTREPSPAERVGS